MVQCKGRGKRRSGRDKPNNGRSVSSSFAFDVWAESVPVYYPDAKINMENNRTLERKRECVIRNVEVLIFLS